MSIVKRNGINFRELVLVDKIKECDDIIEFLVNYTIEHFRDEEEYQKKVGYVDYEIHKKIHNNFKNTVALYQKQLKEDFSSKTLKNFVGTLINGSKWKHV